MIAETVSEKPRILAVDDVAENLTILASILQQHYDVLVSTSGEEALAFAHQIPGPDLILLDVVMPDLDGFEVCRLLKSDPKTAQIPVIFLTAQSDIKDEQDGFDLGASDYISKPISPPIVLARVKTHLQTKTVQDFLRSQNAFLEAEVLRRTREISTVQDVAMLALGTLAETRDVETGVHIQRTQHFVHQLATRASQDRAFKRELDEATIERFFKSAPLHDIGKVGIPDGILLKPGPLTQDEFRIMKTHTTLGARAIETSEALLKSPRSFLRVAREITLTHHERWDGRGYPGGLEGEMIPLSGRFMAVADVYDALRSDRVYKKGMDHETTVKTMVNDVGHFDPRLFSMFLESQQEWKKIYQDLGA
jgi:putative two-component system response regulator